MAEVAPFVGIRYDQSVVGELSKVISPPYDVISPRDRVYYHRLHPANFVRLVLGEEFESDNESDNRFTRAKGYLDDWLARGIMKPDPEPAIYVCEQQFERDGKSMRIRGFTCAVRLHDYADRVILPHENTLAKPKSRIIRLMRETRANLDSIYALYADEASVLDTVLDRVTAGPPACDALDKNGVRHLLWALTEPGGIAAVVDFLASRQIAIADGHHRYETSLAYRDETRRESECAAEMPSDWTLMTLVNVHQRDMTVFPTHRVVGSLPPHRLDMLERDQSELFHVADSSKQTLLSDMARLGAIGLYLPGRALTLKPSPESRPLMNGSEAGRNLELNVLHKLILERSLGIDEDRLRDQSHIVYTRDPDEAMSLVDSGERQAAFLLNNIDVKSVLEVASAGERMPQKATYFYPKLISGLVLRLHSL